VVNFVAKIHAQLHLRGLPGVEDGVASAARSGKRVSATSDARFNAIRSRRAIETSAQIAA